MADIRQLSDRLRAPLRRLVRPQASRGRGPDGKVFDLDVLVN